MIRFEPVDEPPDFQRLRLRDDERVMRQRSEWYRMYRSGELSPHGLAKKAPLIAAAIAKA